MAIKVHLMALKSLLLILPFDALLLPYFFTNFIINTKKIALWEQVKILL
jgi:hypothetical protein